MTDPNAAETGTRLASRDEIDRARGRSQRERVRAPAAGAPGFGTEVHGRFRYRLLKRLGKGAFGSVFFARCVDPDPRNDDSPPEQIAVKILGSLRGQTPQALVKRELAAMLAIQGDRIPRVYDWSLEGEHAFVAMEYYPSGSLRDALPMQGAVEEEAVWRMLADVLSALTVAHKASLLHLDIKPANVLLDGNGGYVLTDFGVSQASRMNRGVIPMSVGSRGYQAPEQRHEQFESYDLRTDLWGVGATAYSMATGINLAERIRLIRDTSGEGGDIFGLPPLSDLRIYCSDELERVVMSMLAIDPARRPGSADEVLSYVRGVVNGSPFEADTLAATRRSNIDEEEIESLVDGLVDPLLATICRGRGFDRYFLKFEDGERLCREGEGSHYAYLLLRGRVRILQKEREIARVSREGAFLGEVATLTGLERTASMQAMGTVWVCALNAAELERFVTCNPAIGLRVIRSMAERLSRVPGGARKARPAR